MHTFDNMLHEIRVNQDTWKGSVAGHPSVSSTEARALLYRSKRSFSGTMHDIPLAGEARSVNRAIERLFVRVPKHNAFEVSDN